MPTESDVKPPHSKVNKFTELLMNPHSLLSDEFFGIGFNTHRARREAQPGLKDRVTACRKRARLHRTMKSTRVRNQSHEEFSEPDSAASQARQYTEEYSAAIAGRLVEEQEVGIT